MSDDLVKRLRSFDCITMEGCGDDLRRQAADRIEELEKIKRLLAMDKIELRGELAGVQGKLAKAVNIADLALDAVQEVQTYDQPDDPWTENALTMGELDVFDFNVEVARTTLAELKGQKP